MTSTLPSIKALSPGRDPWEATLSGRAGGEGGAVAPAAADATDWARAWCALSTTRDSPRAAVFACSISSSNRYRRASRRIIVWLASSSARWALAAAYAKFEGPAWVLRSRERWGWRSAESGEPRWRRWCPVERGEASWWCSPGAGDSWHPAPESGGGWSASFAARTGESTLLAGGSGWWSGGPPSVSSPEPSAGGSPFLESQDLERALPVSWASRLGRVVELSPPRFLTSRHAVACCRSAKISI